ncbi:hypothetical protein FRC11_014323, partial [Ceratobasidium sp. 423]
VRIARHGILVRRWRKQIERFVEREKGSDKLDAAKATGERVETQALVDKAEEAIKALGKLLHDVETRWKKPKDRVLGPIVRAPAIRLGVGEERFTEDWCVFQVDKSKLGDGYRGNKMDLGTEMSVDDFILKCFPHGDADRQFEYPEDRLLPLQGTLTDELMRHPDMWDSAGEPCLLVVKSGNATGTTIGHANGVFSIVRDYFAGDMAVHQTSMEWGIINYDKKSVFSEPGDSGSIIADIRGRIGGMLTGGAGTTKSSDMTYATPFWWLLKRIQNNGLPKYPFILFDSDNSFEDFLFYVGGISLAMALKEGRCPKLETLKVQYGKWDHCAINILAEAIKEKLPNLTALELNGNRADSEDECITNVRDALESRDHGDASDEEEEKKKEKEEKEGKVTAKVNEKLDDAADALAELMGKVHIGDK